MPGIDYSKWASIDTSSSCASSGSEWDGVNHEKEVEQMVPEVPSLPTDAIAASARNSPTSSSQKYASSREDNAGVKVVRLTYPSKVVVGADGMHTVAQVPPRTAKASPFRASPWAIPAPSEPNKADEAGSAVPSQPQVRAGTQDLHCSNAEAVTPVSTAADARIESDRALYAKLTANGGREGNSHLWSQTRESLTIAFIVPQRTKATDIHGFRVFKEDHPHNAFSAPMPPGASCPVTNATYSIAFTNACNWLENEGENLAETIATSRAVTTFSFCHPIRIHEEGDTGHVLLVNHNDDNEADADLCKDAFDESCWEMMTLPSLDLRLLVVCAAKQTIGQGVYHWWDRLFTTDTFRRAERRPAPAASSHDQEGSHDGVVSALRAGATTPAEIAARAWREAHDTFRQRVQARKHKEDSAVEE